MTDFNDLNFILDNLVQYFTGDRVILSLFLLFLFFVAFVSLGIQPQFALVLVLPLLGFFVAIGYFGVVDKAQWIVNLTLVAVGAVYGWAVIRLMT